MNKQLMKGTFVNIYPIFDQIIELPENDGTIGISAPFQDVFRVCVSRAMTPRIFPNYAFVKPQPANRQFPFSVSATTPCQAENGHWNLNVSPDSLTLASTNGTKRLVSSEAPLSFTAEGIRYKFRLGPDQQAYGIGEWGERFARIPGRYELWNTDDSFHQPNKRPYCNIPTLMFSSGTERGWVMLFVNNPGLTVFDLGMKDPGIGYIEVETGDLDMWMICADSPDELIRKWTELTGRIHRPPLWSLGFHQCRWSYMSRDEVLEIAETFRKKEIPLDTIWLDIDYMQNFRVFTWDSKRFSTPKTMCDKLKKMNVRLVTILDPGVKIEPGDEAFEDGLKENVFMRHADGKIVDTVVWPGHVHHPDFTSVAARNWWSKQVQRTLTNVGVDGLWVDMNDPACFGDGPMCAEFPADSVHKDGGYFRTHKALHNVYGMYMAAASQQGLLEAAPDKRPFVLTRSGWAGMQRFTAIWTGDNRASFSSMPYDLVQILSMSMCGVPFIGSDIGGFIGNTPPELMVRWMEHGAFLPFCRAHKQTGMQRHEPWSFGTDTEAKLKKLLQMRYRLLPYLQNAFTVAQTTGRPVVRPLIYDYPEDVTARTIGNEFLFGDSILVAPVLEPGVNHRAVYLPEGEWFCWWTGATRCGGTWITEAAPLGQSPVYVKAGAAIPMGDDIQHTAQTSNTLTFKLFLSPAAGSETTLIQDDGQSFNYEKGEQCERKITVAKIHGDTCVVEIGPLTGSWKPAHNRLQIQAVATAPVAKAIIDGKEFPRPQNGIVSWPEDGKSHKIEWVFEK